MGGIMMFGNQGWTCPVCGKGNAPWMSQCPCDPYGSSTTTTNINTECSHLHVMESTIGSVCVKCGEVVVGVNFDD